MPRRCGRCVDWGVSGAAEARGSECGSPLCHPSREGLRRQVAAPYVKAEGPEGDGGPARSRLKSPECRKRRRAAHPPSVLLQLCSDSQRGESARDTEGPANTRIVAPRIQAATASLAVSTKRANTVLSLTARSASIFRSMSTPALLRP